MVAFCQRVRLHCFFFAASVASQYTTNCTMIMPFRASPTRYVISMRVSLVSWIVVNTLAMDPPNSMKAEMNES